MRLSWLHETPFRAWLLPRTLVTVTAEATPYASPRKDRPDLEAGYVLIFEPTHPNAHKDGYIAEHSKVMVERLGRPLEPFEQVHHKIGIRSDNGPANLELRARGLQPPGSRVRDLIDAE
jgi:hypothetical protein